MVVVRDMANDGVYIFHSDQLAAYCEDTASLYLSVLLLVQGSWKQCSLYDL